MDQGGTFTDVVRVDEHGETEIRKVLSRDARLAVLGDGATDLRRGTTVATNALLERSGAPVLLLTTRGFGDLPWIGDQTRPDLFSLRVSRPPPLVTGVLEVSGRLSAHGEVLEEHGVSVEVLRRWVDRGVRSAAVVLVHGPLAPGAERHLGERCRQAGFTQVSLGHEVAPSRGLLDRLHTTLADAALSPLLPRAPGLYMRSDGGLARETGGADSEWRGAHAVLSGPAGGVVATAALAQRLGIPRALGFDMGGTSTDLCRVEGEPRRTDHVVIDGLRLRVPAVRLETVAAGGGSRLGRQGGVYTVGPRSAGSVPGPACYGRGGPPALSDCDAVLGRLPGFPRVCGPNRDRGLDVEAARTAVAALDPERPVAEVAWGYRCLAAEHMARAVRRLGATEGVDPADHVLIAFGGAGPGHACGVARRLGIRSVVVPLLAGVFSAVGIGAAPRRAEVVVPWTGDWDTTRARVSLPFTGSVAARLAVRIRGTSEPLELPVELDRPPDGLEAAFHEAHHVRYGFARPDEELEIVELRVAVEQSQLTPTLRPLSPKSALTTVEAWFDGWGPVPCLDARDARDLAGPALLRCPGSTVVVEAGWRADFRDGAVHLVDEAPSSDLLGEALHPVRTAVFGARLAAVAEGMGECLARLARSVSIRERRDFSCALFDAAGRLVANAPHVPVHLGAMGETVRDLLRRRADELGPGQGWASNDPYAGGSHLPDITVMRPVYRDGRRVAVVACRGHHVDVGGITPGSMPPFATTIDEEGLVLRQVCIARDGRSLPPSLPGCRQPDEVGADLDAQVAACVFGELALLQLLDEVGEAIFEAQLGHIRAQASAAVREVLGRLEGRHQATETLDDGTELSVSLEVSGGSARVRFAGPPHPGNRNAPRGVSRAALLYVFRCLAEAARDAEDTGAELPLNEGALLPFEITRQPGGLADPVWPMAVAGGNVETSQRIVDGLLRAVGAQAASQGTMNNLTVGTAGGVWYETIAGGAGAGPGFDGGDCVQVHMTNTRATDVEELEARFPVRLEAWRRRRGSGGQGRWRGGDGVEKIWRFLEAAQVALMAERRLAGAPGLQGGEAGAPGEDRMDRGTGWELAPAQWEARPGDRLLIRTPGGGGFGESG